MRIVIAGDYPEDPPNLVGGIQAVLYNTLQRLGAYGDLDLHVVTCEKWRSRPLDRPQTSEIAVSTSLAGPPPACPAEYGNPSRAAEGVRTPDGDYGLSSGHALPRPGRWTVHYLPSSPRIPHSLSMLTVDRRAVRRRIQALAPDLIHAHGQAVSYPFAAFDTGLPTLVTVHGINMLEAKVDPRGGTLRGRLRIALWGWVERRCLRRARDIVVISPFVEQVISPYTRANLHVVENPVHDAFFHLEPEPQPGNRCG